MILCPKCGKVEEYGIKEYAHRVRVFNKNDECIKTAEFKGFRFNQPRCLKCKSIVRFYIEPQESEEQILSELWNADDKLFERGSRDETEVITNQEWLSHISPEDWVRVIHWLYHDYGTRFADSEGAIIQWLRQDMRKEQNDADSN